MNDETTSHHRRSLRLQGYDYAQAGAYFVTICTQHRLCLFGEIIHGEMQLNEAGKMIQEVWHQLPMRFDTLALDEFVVMPNHIHGILVLKEGDSKTGDHKDRSYAMRNIDRRGESCIRPYAVKNETHLVDPCDRPLHDLSINQSHKSTIRSRGTLPDTVGRIVQAFKSITTHAYITGVKQHGWPPFDGKLWQRNYWEHIVRNEPDWNQIRAYIHNNPLQWELDKLNPLCGQGGREA
ncbi:transposase [Nitrosomonas sp. Is37]|nr:transposase [Nitrosomonas sp. Is37]